MAIYVQGTIPSVLVQIKIMHTGIVMLQKNSLLVVGVLLLMNLPDNMENHNIWNDHDKFSRMSMEVKETIQNKKNYNNSHKH